MKIDYTLQKSDVACSHGLFKILTIHIKKFRVACSWDHGNLLKLSIPLEKSDVACSHGHSHFKILTIHVEKLRVACSWDHGHI